MGGYLFAHKNMELAERLVADWQEEHLAELVTEEQPSKEFCGEKFGMKKLYILVTYRDGHRITKFLVTILASNTL